MLFLFSGWGQAGFFSSSVQRNAGVAKEKECEKNALHVQQR